MYYAYRRQQVKCDDGTYEDRFRGDELPEAADFHNLERLLRLKFVGEKPLPDHQIDPRAKTHPSKRKAAAPTKEPNEDEANEGAETATEAAPAPKRKRAASKKGTRKKTSTRARAAS